MSSVAFLTPMEVGVKVTLTLVLLPAGMERGPAAAGTNWPSMQVMLVMFRVAVPVALEMLTAWTEGVVINTSPKARGEGVTTITGEIPVPLSGITVGLVPASWRMVRLADWSPIAVGVKVTLTVWAGPPEGTMNEVMSGTYWTSSEETTDTIRGAEPGLATDIDNIEGEKTSTFPNAREAGVGTRAGALRRMVPAAPTAMATLSLRATSFSAFAVELVSVAHVAPLFVLRTIVPAAPTAMAVMESKVTAFSAFRVTPPPTTPHVAPLSILRRMVPAAPTARSSAALLMSTVTSFSAFAVTPPPTIAQFAPLLILRRMAPAAPTAITVVAETAVALFRFCPGSTATVPLAHVAPLFVLYAMVDMPPA